MPRLNGVKITSYKTYKIIKNDYPQLSTITKEWLNQYTIYNWKATNDIQQVTLPKDPPADYFQVTRLNSVLT